MKFVYSLSLLILLVISGCSGAKKDQPATSIEDIKKTFTPLLKGVWVLTDYISEIEKTKSPLKSAEKLSGVAGMKFAPGIADSITALASWNNHEGYSFSIYWIAGRTENSLKTNMKDYDDPGASYELGFETIDGRASIILYHYSGSGKLAGKRQFSKVMESSAGEDAAAGIQYVVNSKLFAGKYLLTDHTSKQTPIELKDDGTIQGYGDIMRYYIMTDFLGGPEMLDMISFTTSSGETTWLTYKIEGRKIGFYTLTEDAETGEVIPTGELRLTLTKSGPAS